MGKTKILYQSHSAIQKKNANKRRSSNEWFLSLLCWKCYCWCGYARFMRVYVWLCMCSTVHMSNCVVCIEWQSLWLPPVAVYRTPHTHTLRRRSMLIIDNFMLNWDSAIFTAFAVVVFIVVFGRFFEICNRTMWLLEFFGFIAICCSLYIYFCLLFARRRSLRNGTFKPFGTQHSWDAERRTAHAWE